MVNEQTDYSVIWYCDENTTLSPQCLYLCAAVIMLSRRGRNRPRTLTHMAGLIEANLFESAYYGVYFLCMHILRNLCISCLLMMTRSQKQSSFISLVLIWKKHIILSSNSNSKSISRIFFRLALSTLNLLRRAVIIFAFLELAAISLFVARVVVF